MRRCYRCNRLLEDNKFYDQKVITNTYCRECHREYVKNWRKENKEKYYGYIKKCIAKNPEKYKSIAKRYYKRTKPKIKICESCGRKFETVQYHKKYCSESCKKIIRNKRKEAKKRCKGFIPLSINIFPKEIDVDYHHIFPNLGLVIPMPRLTHLYVNGNELNKHFEHNLYWINKLYCIDFKSMREIL